MAATCLKLHSTQTSDPPLILKVVTHLFLAHVCASHSAATAMREREGACQRWRSNATF